MKALATSVKKHLKLYSIFFKHSLMRLMEYRFDFFFRALPTTFSLLINVFMVTFIYSQVKEIAGWSREELFLLLGTYNIVWGIFFGLFIHNLGQVNNYINTGELDLFLTKPVSSQFIVSFRNHIDFGEAATFIFGIVLVILSLGKMGITVSLLSVILYCLLILVSVVLAYSLWLMSVTFSFWFGRIREIHEVFISIFAVVKYPIDIFPNQLKILFTYFIPLGVLVTIPSRFLLKTIEPKFIIFSFLISLVFLFLSNLFWNFGLKHYQSASS